MCVFVPADAECEVLGARFDPVLSLHVRHALCAVAIDGQDGVARTQVPQGRLAAWCYLNNIHTHTHTQRKRKERALISGVKVSVQEKDTEKEN